MAIWHGYVHMAFASAGWTTSELIQIGTYGTTNSISPNENTQLRASLNMKELLMEIKTDESNLTRAAIVTLLANIFGIAEAAIDAQLTYQVFDPSGTWEGSRNDCDAWLIANISNWE